ncbi:hypothetical protein F4803DRAFT_531546 [Xylaria telfairii]|nr:hypothetical protein F4803DRAFT_531546 [Xylaria telfairii]
MSRNLGYVRLRNLNSDNAVIDRDTWAHTQQNTSTSALRQKSWKLLKHRPAILTLLFLASLALNCFLVGKALLSSVWHDQILTYSPALPAVRYERVVFSSGFGIERSPFQGEPSDENNKLWSDLYDFGISRVNADEARPMDNKTLPIPGPEGGYVIQLTVFHQLHCLNLIRKGIYGAVDMTNEDDLLGIEHLDHCIDMLRQGVMCSSDVTPTTFARKSPQSSMKVVAEVVHTCRSFTNIQQWAWNRRLKAELDKDTLVTDDPLGWGTYIYNL